MNHCFVYFFTHPLPIFNALSSFGSVLSCGWLKAGNASRARRRRRHHRGTASAVFKIKDSPASGKGLGCGNIAGQAVVPGGVANQFWSRRGLHGSSLKPSWDTGGAFASNFGSFGLDSGSL